MAEEVLTWIDPYGIETGLNVQWDVDGRFSLPFDFQSDAVPGRQGEVFRSVKHGVRSITIPLWIGPCATDADLRTAMRELVYRLDPLRGDGLFRVQSPLGDQREMVCRASGVSMPESVGGTSLLHAQKAVVTFIAHNPYWQDTHDVALDFTVGTQPDFFPFFPLRLTSSEVFADTTLENDGDVEAWPVWTIKGPGSIIVLSNLTTEETLTLSNAGGLVLASGEQCFIDTREGTKTITRQDGLNLFKYISNDSALWSLRAGANNVRLEMAGSSEPSQLKVVYRQRYLSA